jgi:hypothetical protein
MKHENPSNNRSSVHRCVDAFRLSRLVRLLDMFASIPRIGDCRLQIGDRVCCCLEHFEIPFSAKRSTPDTFGTHFQALLASCLPFRYLGTQITPDLEESFDTDNRIRVATRFFHVDESHLLRE